MSMEGLSDAVRPRVVALLELQNKYDLIRQEFDEEVRALEKKYQTRYSPLYSERTSIVKGNVSDGSERGIPKFWLNALKHSSLIRDMITEADELVLEKLVDIRTSYLEGGSYMLTFEFSKNEFFSNSFLTKTYHFGNEDGEVTFRSEGCCIDWFPSKNLTVRLVKKTQRHKTKNITRMVEKKEACESFFSFFKTIELPTSSDGVENEEIEEELEMYEQSVAIDMEVGDLIRDRIVPEASKWFLGIAVDDSAPFDEDEDYEGSDGDEQGEESSSDEKIVPMRPKKTSECKQQ